MDRYIIHEIESHARSHRHCPHLSAPKHWKT